MNRQFPATCSGTPSLEAAPNRTSKEKTEAQPSVEPLPQGREEGQGGRRRGVRERGIGGVRGRGGGRGGGSGRGRDIHVPIDMLPLLICTIL